MASCLTLLLSTLEDLKSKELKKFRLYLSEGALEGFARMPRGKLQEDSDATDIAIQMTEMYGSEDSLKIALHILREIRHNELAAARPGASLHSAAGAGGGVEDGARGTAAQMMAEQQDDRPALLNYSVKSIWEQALAKATEEDHRLDNVTLNIAVTGHVSVGKSSFVNAIRGLKHTDKGAAAIEVCVTQVVAGFSLTNLIGAIFPLPTQIGAIFPLPTQIGASFPHPTMPNVILWDLPGIGSRTYKAGTYMKDVKYQNYDLFIIVCESRLTENDLRLADEINKTKKKFYFVHTKADIDVSRGEKKGVPMEATLQNIRDKYLENFRTLGAHPVFIITSNDPTRFDFPELVNNLVRDILLMKQEKQNNTSPLNCMVL
ncbi:interferon-inducible GTPase 1-like [Clupea harengus]|uniref:Interferon-inducible GTPase 1-like n=1 Tax=Clupea harengus TaxID=7950 RepID=A0A8M1KA01_CLUHA|nr:interferon-inducible GTPase 1-like [Clupea harengus]